MLALVRHLIAIAVLPFTVAVLVPIWIARQNAVVPEFGKSLSTVALQLAGVTVIGVGLLLFVGSLRRFASG